MSRVYDNWERLVEATLLRERLRQLGRENSLDSSLFSDFSSSFHSDAPPTSSRLTFHSTPRARLKFPVPGVLFTYQQISQATEYFSDANLIKYGHSGDLFRGILDDGAVIVVKRIDLRLLKWEGYVSELEFFSKVSHQRFPSLVGHCLVDETLKFLVYKFMPNGDLTISLFWKDIVDDNDLDDDGLRSLDWITRWKIAVGAAQALSYLHHECKPPIVHRDVQASSILLGEKFEVQLGSLSEVYEQKVTPRQNRIAKLLRLSQNSEQRRSDAQNATSTYDIYCFGKVLLELITGRLGISSSATNSNKLLTEILPYISLLDRDRITQIVDPSLIVEEDLLDEIWAVGIVAKACLNPKPSKRPLMRHVLKALENPLALVREDGGRKTEEAKSILVDNDREETKSANDSMVIQQKEGPEIRDKRPSSWMLPR